MLDTKLVDSIVETFLACEDTEDRRRFYKYLIDECIFEYGGEDDVINIMSVDNIKDFHKLEDDAQKYFINAFFKANIVTEVRKEEFCTYYLSNEEEG